MPRVEVAELLAAGCHFGHLTRRWNPKMRPYIFMERNGIHIVDLMKTQTLLEEACNAIGSMVADGKRILFVGTKKQAKEVLREEAVRTGQFYVSERWLGGTLTNFRTIRARLQRLEELESLVASPVWDTDYSKKMKSTLSRELKKIQRNLSGIRKMNRLPGALVLVDVHKEHNAVREAQSLGIPTIALLDTDSDPQVVNIPIPGNDDSMRSIALVLRYLADAAEEGMKARPEPRPQAEQPEGPDFGAPPRRRGGRRPVPVSRGVGEPDSGGAAVATTEDESAGRALGGPSEQSAPDFGVESPGTAPA